MDGWHFPPGQELRRAFLLDETRLGPIPWHSPGKSAAVVMSVDDVFPGTSQSAYESGGDLEKGALGRLLWLLERHPKLRLTLFVTPDWRRISPIARSFLATRALDPRSRVSRKRIAEGDDGPPIPSEIRFLSQHDAAHRGRVAWPASHQSRSFGFRRIREPRSFHVRCHAGRSNPDFRQIRLALRARTPTAWMELQPGAPASVPGCRNRLVGVRTRYRGASFQGRQNSDVGIERRQHVVSGADCAGPHAHQH